LNDDHAGTASSGAFFFLQVDVMWLPAAVDSCGADVPSAK
jgi:hypothetical protein